MQDYARQAIVTKYHGPTNSKGARVGVTAEAGKKFYHWDDALDGFKNHQAAAIRFANHMGWLDPKDPTSSDRLIGGGTEDGYCFVILDDTPATSLMGDWRDNAVDMLRIEHYTAALETIANESDVTPLEVTQPWGNLGGWTRSGRSFELDGAEQFDVSKAPYKRGDISPSQLDDICIDILKLLRATGSEE